MTTHTAGQQAKETIILTHGGWYGAWAWKKVVPLLKAQGYTVITYDLPGYGNDTTPSATFTLNDYVKKLKEVANAQRGKVILLGHSMGGAIISQTAEVLGSDKVSKLIFLDAFLLKNGETIMQQVSQMNEHQKAANTMSKHRAQEGLVFSEDKKSVLMNPAMVADVFCHDCSEEEKDLLKNNGKWQPVAPLTTPMSLTDARYGVIPKYYILCTESRDLDRSSIVQNVPCQKVYKLPSSHSAFFSMPDKLVRVVEEICKLSVPSSSQ